MCGRYAADFPPAELAVVFGTTNPPPNHPPSWNVAPTQPALVVRREPRSGERHLDALHWGLLPRGAAPDGPRPFNARSETVRRLPLFRDAFAGRRAIVPIRAFYEWRVLEGTAPPAPGRKGKPLREPFAVARADGTVLALAGVWEGRRMPDGSVLRSFAVLTCPANELLRPLHHRMPVVLSPDAWEPWLAGTEADAAALLRPAPEDALRLWPVSTRVNAVRNDDAALLEPAVAVAPGGGADPA